MVDPRPARLIAAVGKTWPRRRVASERLPQPTTFSSDAIGSTATRHGAELLAAGFNVAQVVRDDGDICQAITEIALEPHVPITVEEFHTLNRRFSTFS